MNDIIAELNELFRRGVNYDTRRIAGQARDEIEQLRGLLERAVVAQYLNELAGVAASQPAERSLAELREAQAVDWLVYEVKRLRSRVAELESANADERAANVFLRDRLGYPPLDMEASAARQQAVDKALARFNAYMANPPAERPQWVIEHEAELERIFGSAAVQPSDITESLSVGRSDPVGGQREPCPPGTVGGFGGQAATAEVVDSAERRSPDGQQRTPSLDESNQHQPDASREPRDSVHLDLLVTGGWR